MGGWRHLLPHELLSSAVHKVMLLKRELLHFRRDKNYNALYLSIMQPNPSIYLSDYSTYLSVSLWHPINYYIYQKSIYPYYTINTLCPEKHW